MIAQTTQNTQTTRSIQATTATRTFPVSNAIAKSFVAAIFLMAAGWGWNSGQFVQPVNTSWGPIADTLHVVPLVILLLLSLRFVGSLLAGTFSRGTRNGITAVAVFAVVGCAVMVMLGTINPDPNSVGVHTAEDWMPVIVQGMGVALWFVSLVRSRRAR